MKRKISKEDKIKYFKHYIYLYFHIILVVLVICSAFIPPFLVSASIINEKTAVNIFIGIMSFFAFVVGTKVMYIIFNYHKELKEEIAKIPKYDPFKKYAHIQSLEEFLNTLSDKDINELKYQNDIKYFIKILINKEEDEYLKLFYKKTKFFKDITNKNKDIDSYNISRVKDKIKTIKNNTNLNIVNY